jgi:hypothetical protein
MRVVNDVVVFTLPEVAAASGDYKRIARASGVSILPMDIENPDAQRAFPRSCRRGYFILDEWREALERFEPSSTSDIAPRLPRRRDRIKRVRFCEEGDALSDIARVVADALKGARTERLYDAPRRQNERRAKVGVFVDSSMRYVWQNADAIARFGAAVGAISNACRAQGVSLEAYYGARIAGDIAGFAVQIAAPHIRHFGKMAFWMANRETYRIGLLLAINDARHESVMERFFKRYDDGLLDCGTHDALCIPNKIWRGRMPDIVLTLGKTGIVSAKTHVRLSADNAGITALIEEMLDVTR